MLRRLAELDAKAGPEPVPQPKAKPAPTFMERVSSAVPDSVKNIGTAAYKGLASLAAGAGDALAAQPDFGDAVRASYGLKPRPLDQNAPVSAALEATGYQPKTQGEKYANAIVRSATSALAGPGAVAGPGRALVTGAASGLGGEVAGQLPGIKDSKAEGVARVVGSLVGGTAGGLATVPFKNSKDLAREMFKGTTAEEVEQAIELMKKSKVAGVPVNLDQAMGRESNVSNVVRALSGREEGQAVVDQLRAQPGQVQVLAKRLMGLLPGEVKVPVQIANDTQKAATQALQNARETRTNAVRPLYAQSGELPAEVGQKLQAMVQKAASEAPDTNKGALFQEIADIIKNAQKRSVGPGSTLLGADGQPFPTEAGPINMEKLNDSLRSFTTGLKNVNTNSKAGDKEAVGASLAMVKQLREQMGEVSPKFKAANELYAKLSAEKVDPLKKSVVGRVAGATGAVADKEAVDRILPILARGRDPNAKTSEIRDFAEATKASPEVFQDAVKTNFAKAVSTAEEQVHGKLAPSLPAALEHVLLGNANKRQGLKDQLEAVAVHQGLSKDAIYPGFMNALKIISAAGKSPGSMGPNTTALNQIAGKSLTASGLRMIGLAPGKPAATGLQGYLTADAYKTLAENLTTPEGVRKLQELAKTPVMSVKAQILTASLLGTAAGEKPPGVTNNTSGEE